METKRRRVERYHEARFAIATRFDSNTTRLCESAVEYGTSAEYTIRVRTTSEKGNVVDHYMFGASMRKARAANDAANQLVMHGHFMFVVSDNESLGWDGICVSTNEDGAIALYQRGKTEGEKDETHVLFPMKGWFVPHRATGDLEGVETVHIAWVREREKDERVFLKLFDEADEESSSEEEEGEGSSSEEEGEEKEAI